MAMNCFREVSERFREVSNKRSPRGFREVSARVPRGLQEVSERFPRGLVIGMSSLPACCPSTLPRIFQSGKHAGGLTERFAGNVAKDIKPQTIGRRYAPSGLPMVFPTTYPAKTVCLTIKVKIGLRTTPPLSIYNK